MPYWLCFQCFVMASFDLVVFLVQNRFSNDILRQNHENIYVTICVRKWHLRQYAQFRSLITSSAINNSANSTIGGVGFLLSPRALDNLSHEGSVSPRLLVLELDGNPKVTSTSCYSPHNISEESEVNTFYNDLRSLLDYAPAHNCLLIPGDFNAKIGPPDAKFTFNNLTNRNGEKLFDLIDTNTSFMKPSSQLWTLIDYILCRKKWDLLFYYAHSVKSSAKTDQNWRSPLYRCRTHQRRVWPFFGPKLLHI